MIPEAILMNVVEHLISAGAKAVLKSLGPKDRFDFLLEREDGKRVALEIDSRAPSEKKILALNKALVRNRDLLDQFVLVTPDPPDETSTSLLEAGLSSSGSPTSWIGINDLPALLGISSPGDLTSPEVISSLQTAAITSNIQVYSKEHIGPRVGLAELSHMIEAARPEAKAIPPEYMGLSRQFPYGVIAELYDKGEDLEDLLDIGKRVTDVTVVLSDIKNFTALVESSRPDDLNEIMAKYYRQARALVWDHRGTLDKFIGDATLAVFGYPFSDAQAPLNAVKFSLDVVRSGGQLLTELKSVINPTIETGTRVGITTGDIWTLDIGSEHVEVTFVGAIINLASRLEKQCEVNGLVLDNITRTKAIRQDRQFVESLNLEEKELQADAIKGFSHPIRIWCVPPLFDPIR